MKKYDDWLLTARATETRPQLKSAPPYSRLAARYNNPYVTRLDRARNGDDRAYRQLMEEFSEHVEGVCNTYNWRPDRFEYSDLAGVIIFTFVCDDILLESEIIKELHISRQAWQKTWKGRAEVLAEWPRRLLQELNKAKKEVLQGLS